jgi:phospholipase C
MDVTYDNGQRTDDPIKHVILLMLENHSFDQMLGDLKRIYPEMDGVDPNNLKSNPNGKGNVILQSEMRETQMIHDPLHETADVLEQLKDGNQGFVTNFLKNFPTASQKEQKAIMGYYPLDFLPALHSLARNYTICDRWFSSLPGPTWPNRFFALTGTTRGMVKMPEGRQDLQMVENQTQDTIFDRLEERGKTWNIFYYDFPSSVILTRQREAGKRDKYKTIDQFFLACRPDSASSLPEFCLIEPKYFGLDQNDDHPPHNVMKSQKLVADVYNAVRSNDNLWMSSLLVICYDEHGGFYDHVVPPPALPPDEYTTEYTFDQLGVRVPALIVSPWVKKGVENTTFDHASLLKYLVEKWNLAPLGNRVGAANSLGSAIQSEMRKNCIPTSIRVPFTSLLPAHPEWELTEPTKHHVAITAFLEDAASHMDGMGIEEEGLRAFGWFERRKAWLGRVLIKVGRYLSVTPLNKQSVSVKEVTQRLLK